MSEVRTRSVLVADVGGTNARFAIATIGASSSGTAPNEVLPIELQHPASLAVANYAEFGDAIAEYLRSVGVNGDDLSGACLAVASPVGVGEIRFTNSPWHFSRESLTARFAFQRLRIVNDFEALALQVPHCPHTALRTLRSGEAHLQSARVVLGPGTGLGVAGLIPIVMPDGKTSWRAVPGEGGHAAFAPVDELEVELLRHLQGIYGRVSIERIASGPGLTAIYRFLCQRDGAVPLDDRSEAISQRALSANDPRSIETVNRFLAIVGSFASDATLMFGAVGGVYLGGGILPRLLSMLPDSDFFARFNAKGRYEPWVSRIPIHLIVDDKAALRGAAVALQQTFP